MTLQKANEFAVCPGQKAVFDFGDIAAQARAIVAQATQEAEQIVLQAHGEAKSLRETARQEGYNEGLAEGKIVGQQQGYDQALAEAQEQFIQNSQQVRQMMKAIIEEVRQRKETLLWQAEQDTVKFALAVAEKVIRKTVETDPGVTANSVKAALALVSEETDLEIVIHPQDVEHLKQLLASEDVLPAGSHIRFTPDETVSAGGCIIRTELGQIDGKLETQLMRLRDEILMDGPSENDKAL